MNSTPREIKIGNRLVGPKQQPFIIAEMSGNHNQSLQRALDIVDAAAAAGVDALKIQTYTADTMTIDISEGAFVIDSPKSLWYGKSLYELYEEAHTPWEWHHPIFKRCRERGILGFSTPFDHTAVDFLESLNVPCFKIASFENIDIPLLKRIGAVGKPVIISTGMATVAELDEALEALHNSGCRDIILLKCTSTYPASPVDSNISTIPHMQDLYNCQVGLSDHTLGIGVASAAVAMGATVIEKHFTLRREDGGVDSAFSMEPDEMRSLVEETNRAHQAIGGIKYGPNASEIGSMKFRRSIYAVRPIQSGELFTMENMRVIRPGLGLPPKYIDIILGKKASRTIAAGTPLNWKMIG